MNDFPLFDLFFFMAVAGYFIYRLWTTLGQKDGFNPETLRKYAKTRQPQQRRRPPAAQEIEAQLQALREIDPTFDLEHFLEGAGKAFEMIVIAFNKGDRTTLKQLLKHSLAQDFIQAIQTRENSREICDNTLLRIQDITLTAIESKPSLIQITVRIRSEQIFVTKNAQGDIIEGDPNQIEVIKDIWKFARDPRVSNPNWELVETESED